MAVSRPGRMGWAGFRWISIRSSPMADSGVERSVTSGWFSGLAGGSGHDGIG